MHRLIFLTLFIGQILSVSAQKYKFDYGVKVGVNYSTVLEVDQLLNFEPTNAYKYRTGLNAGAFLMHDFHRFFGLDLELTADILGINATSPTTSLAYYYASAPISVRFNIPEDFFISGSFVPSYFARGTAKDIEGRIESTVAASYFDPINELDLKWSAGIGWRNTERFLLTIHFYQSLNDISDLYPLKHQYVQLGMRYFLKEDIRRMMSE